jgi:hypothetical protein
LFIHNIDVCITCTKYREVVWLRETEDGGRDAVPSASVMASIQEEKENRAILGTSHLPKEAPARGIP